MPTRKFSEETNLIGTVVASDIVAVTQDPLGTPVSGTATAQVLKNYVLLGTNLAPMVPLVAADFGAYVLLNGGSVVAATLTDLSGAASGALNDMLVVNITNPTPGIGPLILKFPITLGGGIPASNKIDTNNIPGSVLHDYSIGVLYDSDNATSLAMYRNFEVTPGANYNLKMAEFDALSGSAASWDSLALPYAIGEQQEMTLQTVTPFAAVPRLQVRIDTYGYDAAGTLSRTYYTPQSVAAGTLNASGAWTGALLTGLGVIVVIGTSYVGTITHTFQLAKNF